MPLQGWEGYPRELEELAPWGYRVKVLRWVDGDTFIGEDNYGKRITQQVSYRIVGYDAPELFSGTPDGRERGRRARAYAESLMPPGSFCYCYTYKDGQSFNRYLASVMIVHEGEAHPLLPLLLAEQERTGDWRADG